MQEKPTKAYFSCNFVGETALTGLNIKQLHIVSNVERLWILKTHCYNLIISQFLSFLFPLIFTFCVVKLSHCLLSLQTLFSSFLNNDFQNHCETMCWKLLGTKVSAEISFQGFFRIVSFRVMSFVWQFQEQISNKIKFDFTVIFKLVLTSFVSLFV